MLKHSRITSVMKKREESLLLLINDVEEKLPMVHLFFSSEHAQRRDRQVLICAGWEPLSPQRPHPGTNDNLPVTLLYILNFRKRVYHRKLEWNFLQHNLPPPPLIPNKDRETYKRTKKGCNFFITTSNTVISVSRHFTSFDFKLSLKIILPEIKIVCSHKSFNTMY